MTYNSDLIGKLLIAMPGMDDDRFNQTVVFLCAHDENGAMGLIINKPTSDISFAHLLEQLSIKMVDPDKAINIHYGGPVEMGRGFVLHSPDYQTDDATQHVNDSISMTVSLDILEDISTGDGPRAALIALGYAGWGPGQLEREIQQNGWLLADCTSDLVFESDNGQKWAAALKRMGIDPRLLSAQGGRA